MRAVVDSSALVHLLTVDPPDGALAERLSRVVPHAPDIIDVELHHALRGLLIGGRIRRDRAEQARELFGQTPLLRFPSHALGDRIWSLRDSLGAYDASFIALAEVLEAPLVTCDAKQRGEGLHTAAVEVF